MITPLILVAFLILLINLTNETYIPKRDIVTVCNDKYCDELEPISWCPEPNHLHCYITSEDGDRHRHQLYYFKDEHRYSDADYTIKINPCKKFQKIIGFGGALTDAACSVISCLSPRTKKCLMISYFHPHKGIGINFLRIPIGGCDFSPYYYVLDSSSTPNPYLTNFKLNKLDTECKIPLYKEAQLITDRKIHTIGATWYAPSWCTTEYQGNMTQFLVDNLPPDVVKTLVASLPEQFQFIPRQCIKDEYLKTWAIYLSKALTEYKKRGVPFSYVSCGNEVIFLGVFSGCENHKYQNWITNYLCPQLVKDGHYDTTKVVALDDMTYFLPEQSKMLENPATRKCVKGFATHWYLDYDTEQARQIQDDFCKKWPEQILISSESSQCEFEPTFKITTDWQKWMRLAKDMMVKLSSCLRAYLDWNLALNPEGGPNWIKNYCYSAVTVNCTSDEFYKKVMFYGLGHFSKFLPEGSVRLETKLVQNKRNPTLEPIKVIAFEVDPESAYCRRPNTVIIILNDNDVDLKADIFYEKINRRATIKIPKNSIISAVALQPWDYDCY